ncbi:Histone methylation protein [Phytophthora megakarya]|uniref:Histone methylation protein n=1 Tax=Phytophthora megakarya TaxID=4795 RepID=A0A225WL47_9STRA|nr:Histone methylation protein [Phytophthora megakarya]
MVRSSFSFDDDKQLVQLARAYEDAGSRVQWSNVTHKMRRTGHTASALKQRLRALMRTHGNRISSFPPSFFTSVRRPREARRTPPLSPTSSEQAVHAIFAIVPRELVVSYDGHETHRNVGEILPGGISMLLAELDIDNHDIFMDIGAGLGNVVAQVVLQTKVYRAIGIECREDVLRAGTKAISTCHYA